jgi:hypothetical protein
LADPTCVVHVAPPGSAVTTVVSTGLPPSDCGGVHVTVTCPLPVRRPEITGADGVVEGAIGLEGVEAAEAPAALLATTVTMYDVPFTSAVI